jgi:hypothetical protein
VEAITPFNIPSQPQRRPLSFKLLPFKLMACSLVVGFTILIVCARGLAQYTPLAVSPFAAFADIFPGKPADALKARDFFCVMTPDTTLATATDEHCNLKLETGSITEITVIVARREVFQIQFMFRENAPTLGDLMLCLGTPQKHLSGHTVDFVWSGSGVYALANSDSRQFFPLMPLSEVSFTDARASGLELLGTCL